MAKMQVFTYDNLTLYDELLKGYVDAGDAKSLKTVAIDGNTLKFYRVSEPVGDTVPAYTITLPETDLSGLIPKITGAVAGNVVTAKADGTVEDSGVKVADLATKAEVEAEANRAKDAEKVNSDAISAINDANTGILKTAKDYADLKVSGLADGQVKTNKEAIDAINNETTGILAQAKTYADGKDDAIAEAKKAGTDAQADIDALEAKVGDVSTLTTSVKSDVVSAVNEVKSAVDSAKTAGEVTVTTDSTTEGYLKTYTIKQGGVEISKIDIPKDLVVVSGEVVVDPEGQTAGTYIKLVIANQEAPIYINVKSLVDVYTAEQSATQIQLSISDTNEISATIVAGSVGTTELTDGSVTTVKIADANVTLAKLASDVTDAIADAKKAGTDASAAVTALEEGAVATNTANIATLQGLVGEGFEPISESFIRGLFA